MYSDDDDSLDEKPNNSRTNSSYIYSSNSNLSDPYDRGSHQESQRLNCGHILGQGGQSKGEIIEKE